MNSPVDGQPACHALPREKWCDWRGTGDFMGHTCAPPKTERTNMTRCARCSIELPPGAAHVNEASCITALVAKLEEISSCRDCQTVLQAHYCPSCAAKGYASGALGKLGERIKEAAKQKAMEWANRPTPDAQDNEGRSKSGGKKFTP